MRWVRVESVAATAVSAVVAVIGAAAGFTHTHDAARAAGQVGWLAWADAVVIESLVVVAGYQLYRYRKAGQSVRFPATVLVVAFLVQMGAQVSGAPRTPAGWLFAAMPALGCLVVIKLVTRRLDQADQSPTVRDLDATSPAHPKSVEVSVVRDGRPAIESAPPVEPRVASWPPR